MGMSEETLIDSWRFMEDLVLAKEIKREGCYQKFVMQGTYASPKHGLERLTRKNSGCNKSMIDFFIIGKVDRMFFRNVYMITVEF